MMKKWCILLLVLTMLLPCMTSLAVDAGVVMIGSKEKDVEPASLDDMRVNVKAEIPGYATLLTRSVDYQDELWHYMEGWSAFSCTSTRDGYQPDRTYFKKTQVYESGKEAEFLIIKLDILNQLTQEKMYTDKKTNNVIVVFDDKHKFQGWIEQYDYDKGIGCTDDLVYFELDVQDKNRKIVDGYEWLRNYKEFVVLYPKDQFPIKPMYTGHYAIGCTLPNSVVESKAPLRVEVQLDEHSLTFHIRK